MLKHTMLFVLKFEHTPKPARETFGCTRADAVLAKQELSHSEPRSTTVQPSYCGPSSPMEIYHRDIYRKSIKAIRKLSDIACE